MKRAILLLGLAAPVFGSTSLRLSAGAQGAFTIPPVAPFTSVANLRIEMRLHDLTCQDGAKIFAFGNGLGLYCWLDGASLAFWDANYSIAALWPRPAGNADISLRLMWDSSAGELVVEEWTTATGARVAIGAGTRSGAPSAPRNLSGSYAVGDSSKPAFGVSLAWVAVYSTLVARNGTPPAGPRGDLMNWVLETGNLADNSGHSINLSLASPSWVATPRLNPIGVMVLPGTTVHIPDPALRAGHPARLDASASYSPDGLTLAYSWSQLSGPSMLTWSGANTSTPTIDGTVFGEYRVRLHLVDSDSNQSDTEFVFGAVPSDDDGIVQFDDPKLAHIFGKIIRFGANPWEWADSSHRNLSNKWGSKYNVDPNYSAQWRQYLAGNIDVTTGSTAVVGHGTRFDVDFCGGAGGTVPVINAQLVVYNAGIPAAHDVASCSGSSSLSMQAYEAASMPTLTGATYAAMTNIVPINFGWAWTGVGGGTNANYYDNVLGHYNLYYRSGLTKYRDYARALADLWTDSPWFGKATYPRVLAINGIILSAYERSSAALWSKVESVLDARINNLTGGTWVGDVRENAYLSSFYANASKLEPNPAKAASYLNALNTAITNVWIPSRNPGGYSVQQNLGWSWMNAYDQLNFTPVMSRGATTATVPAGPGTVSLTNGSKQVVGSGTNFLAAFCRGSAGNPPHKNNSYAWERIVVWTGTSYIPAFVDSCQDNTHLTLLNNWRGSTMTGRQWSLSWPYWSMSDLWKGSVQHVTLTQNSTKVTFDGNTRARDLFCQYGSSATTPNFYSVFLAQVDPSAPNVTSTSADQADVRIFSSTVVSCDSQSQITLAEPWPYPSGDRAGRWGMGGKLFWLESDPKEIGYQIVMTDPVTARLDRAADNASVAGYTFRVDGGPSVQPFMSGLAATAFNWMYKATGNATIRDYIHENATWLTQNAIIPNYWGYYYIFAPGCWTDPTRLITCGGKISTEQDIWAARYLTAETYNGLAAAYELSGDESLKSTVDSLYSACFGRTGYAGTRIDNEYCLEIAEAETSSNYDKAKTFGFFYGMGNIAAWPAARNAPADPCSDPVLAPVSATVAASGGVGSISVTFGDQSCTWAATSPAPWVVIMSGSSGTGDGIVEYVVANNGATDRTTTLTIAGRGFIISQPGTPAGPGGATSAAGIQISGAKLY